MALPVMPQVIRMAVRGKTPSGAPFVNVHHLNDVGGGGWPSALQTAAITALTNFYTPVGITGTPGVLAYCTAGVTTQDVQSIKLDGSAATVTTNFILAGNAGGDSLPSDSSLVVTLRTGVRGRSKRGRLYLPPFAEVNCDANGRLVAAQLTAINTLLTKHLAALSSAGIAWVVASYKLGTFQTVTIAEVNNVFDRQARRKA